MRSFVSSKSAPSASTPRAIPATALSPTTTCAARPYKPSRAVQASRNAANPNRSYCASILKSSSKMAPATILREVGDWQASVSAATAVPSVSISRRASAGSDTLTPTPITTCAGPPASARNSIRTPPNLRSSNQMSLGHLSFTLAAPARVKPRDTATPTPKLNAGKVRTTSLQVQPSDMAMPPPKGATQRRPRRPRPACCSSAMQTSAVLGGGGALPRRRGLVDPTSNSKSRVCRYGFWLSAGAGRRRRAAQQAGVGRSDLEQQLQVVQIWLAIIGEFGADLGDIEQLHWSCQTVTAARQGLHLNADRPQAFNAFPYRRSGLVQLRRQRLAGVHFAIRQQLKQRRVCQD